MHISIPVDQSCEFLNIVPMNPLISKCQIKVCYVGDEPNRNGSIITKETAKKMANSLPGCPIVGFYNEASGDFEEHNQQITISNGVIKISDTTIPYGFVDMNAKVWFQKFLDDGEVEHEYLMTEGYIWTGQYPEAQRVITKGNNQSMELDENSLDATWSKDNNGSPQFFIINEAIISKLCILGEDVEPCFEGSQITKVQFSLDEDFQSKFVSMANELKQILDKGGVNSMPVEIEEKDLPITDPEEEPTEYELAAGDVYSAGDSEEVEEAAPAPEEVENSEVTQHALEENQEVEEGKIREFTAAEIEEIVNADVEFSVEESDLYIELKEKYDALCTSFSELQAQYDNLKKETDEELTSLREFKANVEKAEKQQMIDSFYMLSDEDKKEVVDNIDKYSLDDIEAKLSVICVRNKVSFNLDEGRDDEHALTFNNVKMKDDAPAWVKAVRENMK